MDDYTLIRELNRPQDFKGKIYSVKEKSSD